MTATNQLWGRRSSEEEGTMHGSASERAGGLWRNMGVGVDSKAVERASEANENIGRQRRREMQLGGSQR